MLVNIYVPGLILKGKFTSIHISRETSLNRSFSGLQFSKIKRLDHCPVQSSPVAVFLWSQNQTSKHYAVSLCQNQFIHVEHTGPSSREVYLEGNGQ